MITEYIDYLLGEGFCSSEFGMMVAAVVVVSMLYILVKTVLGWFRDIF